MLKLMSRCVQAATCGTLTSDVATFQSVTPRSTQCQMRLLNELHRPSQIVSIAAA